MIDTFQSKPPMAMGRSEKEGSITKIVTVKLSGDEDLAWLMEECSV